MLPCCRFPLDPRPPDRRVPWPASSPASCAAVLCPRVLSPPLRSNRRVAVTQVASLSNLATVYEAMGQAERAAAMQSLVAQMKRTWEEKQRAKKR